MVLRGGELGHQVVPEQGSPYTTLRYLSLRCLHYQEFIERLFITSPSSLTCPAI